MVNILAFDKKTDGPFESPPNPTHPITQPPIWETHDFGAGWVRVIK